MENPKGNEELQVAKQAFFPEKNIWPFSDMKDMFEKSQKTFETKGQICCASVNGTGEVGDQDWKQVDNFW